MNKIPLWDTYLSNENFDEITDFENFNLLIKRIDDHVDVIFKHTYSPNIFICENSGFYYLCVNYKVLTNVGVQENNIKREREFFNTLRLYKDHYEFEYLKSDSIGICYYEDYDENPIFFDYINLWVNKYVYIISKINPEDLYIEMSAGIDTRILSYFWRYNPYTYDVYTKPNSEETETAKKIIQFLNDNYRCTLNITTKKNNSKKKFSLSGASLINGYFAKTTSDDFKDIIGNSLACNKAKHIVCGICPFYDKLLLSLKGDFPGQIKLLLYYLLCEDKGLNKLKVMSFERIPFILDDNLINFTRVEHMLKKRDNQVKNRNNKIHKYEK